MAAEDEIKSVRESGESFLIWSVVLLLVVNLLIFPALTKDRKTVNQVIGNEVRRLNDQRILLERDLRRIEREISVLKEHPELGRARRFDQLGFNSDEGNLVQENIVSLSRVRKDVLVELRTNAEKIVLLAKSKYSRELKIPGTDTAIDESQIRLFYPIALGVWFLIWVFRFRNPLYRLLAKEEGARFPFWCAPLPYGKGHFWPITGRNLVWLSSVGLLARLFLNSSQRGEFYSSGIVFILNVTGGIIAAITCVVLISEVIWESFQCLRVSGTN